MEFQMPMNAWAFAERMLERQLPLDHPLRELRHAIKSSDQNCSQHGETKDFLSFDILPAARSCRTTASGGSTAAVHRKNDMCISITRIYIYICSGLSYCFVFHHHANHACIGRRYGVKIIFQWLSGERILLRTYPELPPWCDVGSTEYLCTEMPPYGCN